VTGARRRRSWILWKQRSPSWCSTSRGGWTAKTVSAKNVFEGGFLGLDNISVFDRSAPLPTGGNLEQADGTAWMALFCQNMAELAVELASRYPAYGDLAGTFADHFLWIAAAMNRPGTNGMWDEEDGFYYDLLRLPNGTSTRLKVRSMVGPLPLCATTVIEPWQRVRMPLDGEPGKQRQVVQWTENTTAYSHSEHNLRHFVRLTFHCIWWDPDAFQDRAHLFSKPSCERESVLRFDEHRKQRVFAYANDKS
jgi:hypothetical protein